MGLSTKLVIGGERQGAIEGLTEDCRKSSDGLKGASAKEVAAEVEDRASTKI